MQPNGKNNTLGILMRVVADTIDMNSFTYKCPICFTKYKKDGTPYKNAKPLIHIHGSSGDTSDRIETRSHHTNREKFWGEVEITINADTIRKCS